MSTETWLNITEVLVHQENDGWAFMRRGSEEREWKLPIDDAVSAYGLNQVVRKLHVKGRPIIEVFIETLTDYEKERLRKLLL